jgi:magnesium-transporting ATPase (P-type)
LPPPFSSLSGLFDNRCLIGAVALSLFAHTLIIYVPVLQTAFRTVSLTMTDWLVTTAIAAMLIVLTELIKLVLRIKSRPAPAVRNKDIRRSPSN